MTEEQEFYSRAAEGILDRLLEHEGARQAAAVPLGGDLIDELLRDANGTLGESDEFLDLDQDLEV